MSTYEIIMTVLAIIFGGLSLYFGANNKLNKTVTDLINQTEDMYKDSTKAGGKKFEWVVDKLYSFIPVKLTPFISRALVEAVVQKTFDIMQSFAKTQLDKIVDKAIPKVKSEATPAVVEAPKDNPNKIELPEIPQNPIDETKAQ
jgi:hypothetical protein